jgi:3-methyladenine DNA glycosylase AlkC
MMIGFDTMDTDNYKRWTINQQIRELQKKLSRLIKFSTDDSEKITIAQRIKNLQQDLSES